MNKNEIVNNIVQNLKQPLWGSWYIKEKIGSGAFGAVYKVEAKRPNRVDVSAMKVQPITADNNLFADETRKRAYIENRKKAAESESDIMYRLRQCGNIVTYEEEDIQELIIDGKFEGYYFLIRMEYLSCVSDMIRDRKIELSEANVLNIARQIGNGIRSAHSIGVIHRDIKPDNFFVSGDGTYKLGDFNVSKLSETARSFAGASGYIAPEVYRAKSNVDECYTNQADIYSFGICLYQFMNGLCFPFEENCDMENAIGRRMNGEPLPFPKYASEAFGRIILKACAFNTADRYASIDEMLSDLESVIPSSAQFAPGAVSGRTAAANADTNRTMYANAPDINGTYNNRQQADPPMTNYNNQYVQPNAEAEKSSNHIIPIIIVTAAIVACIAAGIIFALLNSGKDKSETVKTAEKTTVSEDSEDIYDPEDDDKRSESVPEEIEIADITDISDRYDREDSYYDRYDHTDVRDTSKHETSDSSAVEPTENTTSTLSNEELNVAVQHDLEFTPVEPEDGNMYKNTSPDMGTNNVDIPKDTGLDIITGTKKVMQAYWFDITRGEDYKFNGEYMTADFRIKEDAENGIYPITVEYCDAANYDAITIRFDLVDGAVVVGGKAKKNSFSGGSGVPYIMVSNVSGKQGDIVTVRFMINNNPGVVGNVLRFGYNSDALEYVGGGEGADFNGHFR